MPPYYHAQTQNGSTEAPVRNTTLLPCAAPFCSVFPLLLGPGRAAPSATASAALRCKILGKPRVHSLRFGRNARAAAEKIARLVGVGNEVRLGEHARE